LMVLLLGASSAMAYPTQADIRDLHEELDEIVRQLDALAEPRAGTSDEQRVADHLALVERHLRSVGVKICGECKGHSFEKSPYRSIAETCADTGRVTSSLLPQVYANVMRQATHAMHDHISRMSHQNLPYKRQQLLPWYYRHVLDALDRAKPTCQRQESPQAANVSG
jgi:hypothetical protein